MPVRTPPNKGQSGPTTNKPPTTRLPNQVPPTALPAPGPGQPAIVPQPPSNSGLNLISPADPRFADPRPGMGQEDPGGAGGGAVTGGGRDPNQNAVTGITTDPVTGAQTDIDGNIIPDPLGSNDALSDSGIGVGASKLAGLVDPAVFASIVSSLNADDFESITAVDVAPDGTIVVTITGDSGVRQMTVDATVAAGGLGLERDRLELANRQTALDESFRRDELRINEELGRINAEIAHERLRVDAQIANGQLALALETQDRIDQREKQSRQLERDLFNANMGYQRQVLQLETAKFDLERQRFLADLGSQPGSLLDFFNISRGLPVAGLGGQLPDGISRAVGLNPSQQANAGAVVQVPELPQFGETPQVGNEAIGQSSEFDLSQFFAGIQSFGNISAGAAAASTPVPAAPTGNVADQAAVVPNPGSALNLNPNPASPPPANGGPTVVPQQAVEETQPGGTGGASLPAGGLGLPFQQDPQQAMAAAAGSLGLAPQQTQAALAEIAAVGSAGNVPNQPNPPVPDQQPKVGSLGFQAPPELAAVFAGGQASAAGELQLPDTGVPFLSPQQLAGLTPAARELYDAYIRVTGLRPEDFNFIASQRAPTQRPTFRQA